MNLFELIMSLVFLVVYFGVIAIGIIDYIITSKSLYYLAQRRGIDRPWISWIPVIKNITIGDLAQEYDSKSGFERHWRKVLTILTAVTVIGVVSFYFIIIFLAIGIQLGHEIDGVFITIFFIAYIGMIGVAFAAMALYILRGICVYKIYESTVPKKAIKYILLSSMLPLAGGICLLKCKDKGYPQPEIIEENL